MKAEEDYILTFLVFEVEARRLTKLYSDCVAARLHWHGKMYLGGKKKKVMTLLERTGPAFMSGIGGRRRVSGHVALHFGDISDVTE